MFSDYLAYSTQTTPHSQAQSQFDDLWKADVEVSVNDLLFSSPIIEHNSFNYFTYDLDCDYENNLHTIPSSSASPSNSAISTNQLYCHNTPSTPSLVPSSPISPVASIYSPYQPQDQYEQYNSLCMAQSGAPLSVYEIDTSPYSLKLPTSPVFDQAPYVSHYAGYSEPTNVADYVTDVKVDCDYDVDVEIEDPKDQDFSPPPSPTPGRNARIQLPPRLAQLPSSPVSDISRTNITLPQVSTAPVIPTQLNQVSQEDFDANPALVLDEYPNADKPSTTYAQLLTVAIKRAPKQKLLLDQIYDIFICKYRSFKSQKDSKGWQNSVRHNLSLYACFYQEERLVGEKGRGKYWLVDDSITSVAESNKSRKPKGKPVTTSTSMGEKRSARSAKTRANKRAKYVSESEDEVGYEVAELPKACKTKKSKSSHADIIVKKPMASEDEDEDEEWDDLR